MKGSGRPSPAAPHQVSIPGSSTLTWDAHTVTPRRPHLHWQSQNFCPSMGCHIRRPRLCWRRGSILRFWEAKATDSKLPLPPRKMTWTRKCGRRGAGKSAGTCRGAGHTENLDRQPCPTPARAEQRTAGRGGQAPAGGARSHSLLRCEGSAISGRSGPAQGRALSRTRGGSRPYGHLPRGAKEPCAIGRRHAEGGTAAGRLCTVVEVGANGQLRGGAPGPARE